MYSVYGLVSPGICFEYIHRVIPEIILISLVILQGLRRYDLQDHKGSEGGTFKVIEGQTEIQGPIPQRILKLRSS